MEVKERPDLVVTQDKETAIITYNYKYKNKSLPDIFIILGYFILIFILILIISFSIFSLINAKNTNIISGVYIKGIDVSGLSKEEAYKKVSKHINSSIPKEIKLTHNDYETSISPSELSINFNVQEATEIASKIGKDSNFLKNNITILEALFSKVNIEPAFKINKEELKNKLQDISSKLPDKIIESSYYIDGNNLIITKGSTGSVVNIEETANIIEENTHNLTLKNTSIELITEER